VIKKQLKPKHKASLQVIQYAIKTCLLKFIIAIFKFQIWTLVASNRNSYNPNTRPH